MLWLYGERIAWAVLVLPGGVLVEHCRSLKTPVRRLGGGVNDPGKTHLCLEVEALDGLLAKLHTAGTRSAHSAPVEIPRGNWRGFRCGYRFAPGGAGGGRV